jgi:predicted RNase H-like HicB family nuclease
MPLLPECVVMSPESGTNSSSSIDGRTITLIRDGDWWVVRDETIGVTSQGKSRTAALENLDEAVALYNGNIGHEPTDEELREMGIDPERNVSGTPESDIFEFE